MRGSSSRMTKVWCLVRPRLCSAPLREVLRAALRPGNECSPVAQAVGGALPLRDVLGDDAGRLHRGLAELGIAGDLALDALSFRMQQVAQAFQFRDEILDLSQRGSGDALDQRVDVVDR